MCVLRTTRPLFAGGVFFSGNIRPSSARIIHLSPWPLACHSPLLLPSQRPFSHAAPCWRYGRDPPRREARRRDMREGLGKELEDARPLINKQGFDKFIRSRTLHVAIVLSLVGAAVFYYMNLQTVPISGRRRFNCYSHESVKATAEAQVKRIEYELARRGGRYLQDWDARTVMVKKVLDRLIPVSGMADEEWEVKVIDEPRVANAFVLPGGKVFVYSGLIPIARNEQGLAAVLGHEIAHNLAGHVAEQMSSRIGINILMYTLMALTVNFGVGQYQYLLDLLFSHPMGRRQEAEADYIGLMIMAEACYDPREAIIFWERMKRVSQNEPLEWLSTHPSKENRIQKIQEWMPQALQKLHESDCQNTSHFADYFRQAIEQQIDMQWRPNI
ncbi:peptidase family M48-domain-containing protein [Astrocystis sublimbata]|nr:peptidase family M48-domain-containing protein [Astrocystis sublimbata]